MPAKCGRDSNLYQSEYPRFNTKRKAMQLAKMIAANSPLAVAATKVHRRRGIELMMIIIVRLESDTPEAQWACPTRKMNLQIGAGHVHGPWLLKLNIPSLRASASRFGVNARIA
eukprot:3925982-Amphidinium_carterae.1